MSPKIANAILRQQKDREIVLLKERLEAENVYPRDEIELKHGHEEIVGESAAVNAMLAIAERVAETDAKIRTALAVALLESQSAGAEPSPMTLRCMGRCSVWSIYSDRGDPMSNQQTISLILGSGGARGLTHIGVIRELEERGYMISSIVGCSMGALIGGFHAAGKLDAYESWVTKLSEWDVLRFLDISLTSRSGMMKGDLIMDELRALVGDTRIEDLPLRFTAVATDVVNHKEVWLSRGDLFDAIRASISIPGIFTPKMVDGRTLVDGGLLNPLPVAPATDDTTDLTIAVNLAGREVSQPLGPNPAPVRSNPIEEYRSRIEGFIGTVQTKLGIEHATEEEQERPIPLTDVLMGMFDTMQSAISRYRLASYPPDILIDIPGNVCKTHEFFKAEQLIAAGRYWARDYLDR